MTPYTDLLALLLIVAAAMASPGPDMVLVARYALADSARSVRRCIAGIVLGITVHLTFALTGLAAVAALRPDLLEVVRWLGAGWLAWLGIAALRSDGGFSVRAGRAERELDAGWAPFRAGLLSNLLNVKVLLMMTALFAGLLPPSAPPTLRLIGAALLALEVAVVWSAFARLVRLPPVRERLGRHAGRLDRLFGALLLVFAVLVAASR